MEIIANRIDPSGKDASLSAWRRTRRLDRLIGPYVVTLVVMLGIILISLSSLTYLDGRTRGIDGIRLDARRLLELQIDQETGLRGYDATGVQAFLAPYAFAQQPLETLIVSLRDRLGGNAKATAAIEHFALLHEAWTKNVALPIIADVDDPQNDARLRAGKRLVDAQREDIAMIDDFYAREFARVLAIKSGIRYLSTAIVVLAVLIIATTGYVSERRSVSREEELLRTIISERDAQWRRSEWRTKIIAMLAHDFRSSLGVIRAYADMLESFPEKRDEPGAYRGIRNAVADLAAMSEEALLMARMTNNALNVQLRPQSIAAIVRDAAARFKEEREVRVEGGDELVMGDRQYLVRVFDNLIGNAIKYSPEGTPVTVTMRRRGDNEIEVAVSDRGRGIDAADLPHVFEEFWRAQSTSERSGSGIGLFIVKKIVDAHGGSAKIESQPGAGTTVRIVLPAATAEVAAAAG